MRSLVFILSLLALLGSSPQVKANLAEDLHAVFDSAASSGKSVYLLVTDNSPESTVMSERLEQGKLSAWLEGQQFLQMILPLDSAGSLRLECDAYPAHLFFRPDSVLVVRAFGCMEAAQVKGFAQRAQSMHGWMPPRYELGDRHKPHWMQEWELRGTPPPMDSLDAYRRGITEVEWFRKQHFRLLEAYVKECDTAGFRQIAIHRKQFEIYFGECVARLQDRMLEALAVEALGQGGSPKEWIDRKLSALLPDAYVEELGRQAMLHLHAKRKDWGALFDGAMELFSFYPATDRVVYAWVSAAMAEHISDPVRCAAAAEWAQRALDQMPEDQPADVEAARALAILHWKAGNQDKAHSAHQNAEAMFQRVGMDTAPFQAECARLGWK